MLSSATALEHRRQLCADPSGMPISELVEDAAVLVEQTMMRVYQFEEGVTAIKLLRRRLARLLRGSARPPHRLARLPHARARPPRPRARLLRAAARLRI